MNETPETYFAYVDALEVSNLSKDARHLGMIIARHYNYKKSEDAFPGNVTLALKMGTTERTVMKYKKELVESGWLVSERRFGTSSLYRPSIPAGFDVAAAQAEQRAKAQEANKAEAERKAESRKKAEDKHASRIAELEAQLAALQTSQEPVKAQKAPEVSQPATEPQKAAEEPYETSTNLSWGGDTKTDAEILAEDVFEEVAPIAPVVEKKAQAPKKARTTKKPVEKVDPMQAAMEQARRRKAVEAQVVEEKLNEAENPEKALELFNDETWKPETTDKVQRASLAALFSTTVEEDKELVAAKSFEMEW